MKAIRLLDVKGLKLTPEVRWMLEDINAKCKTGRNGRYFGGWWFEECGDKEEIRIMEDIIYYLTLNWVKQNAMPFNSDSDSDLYYECKLDDICGFVADKLNVYNKCTIEKIYRTMYYDGYGVRVEDACGLNCFRLTPKTPNR